MIERLLVDTLAPISIFINFAVCLLLSLLLASFGNKYKNFVIFNINVALWSLFYLLHVTSNSEETALLYAKISFFFVVFIAYLSFNVALETSRLELKQVYKRAITIIAIIFASLMLTPWMILGVRPFHGFQFVPYVSIWYYVFLIYFAALVIASHAILYPTIKDDYRNRLIFIGFIVGFSGGMTNFFQWIGLPVYPLGNFLVFVYCIITAYAVMRKRVLDAFSTISRGAIKLIVSSVLIVFYTALISVFDASLHEDTKTLRVVFQVLYFVVAFELYQVLVNRFDLVRESLGFRIHNKRDILIKINKSLVVIELDQFSFNLTNLIENDIGIKVKSFYISSSIEGVKENGSEYMKYSGEDIQEGHIHDLQEFLLRKKPELSIKYNETDQKLKNIMRKEGFEALVPFIRSDGKYLGFILLKTRNKKRDFFFLEDMELFDELVFKVGDALERIRGHLGFLRDKERFHQDQIKSKELLARAIAHEMRSPISAVSLQVEESFSKIFANQNGDGSFALSEDDAKELTRTQRLLEKLTDRANETIDRLLAEARGERIEVKQDYLSANQQIKEALLEFGFRSREHRKKVNINVKDDFIFKGTESQFLQVIHNLIKNALDLVKEKPDLIVTISTEITEAYNIIHVEDTGPGMPEEVRARLYKGDMVTAGKEGGTGVGSNVSKQIMVGFGGDIVCRSELGKGTRISLLFPKLSQDELDQITVNNSEQEKPVEEVHDFSAYSFLITDDNPTVLSASSRLAQRKLKGRIETAANFAQSIDKLSKDKFDMILLDIQLDDDVRAGIEIAKQIKTNPDISAKNKDAILICISGDKDEEALKAGGFDDYLGKIMPNNLLPMVVKWLGKKGK